MDTGPQYDERYSTHKKLKTINTPITPSICDTMLNKLTVTYSKICGISMDDLYRYIVCVKFNHLMRKHTTKDGTHSARTADRGAPWSNPTNGGGNQAPGRACAARCG